MKIEETIDHLHLEDLQNEMHPSIFFSEEKYSMLIIRLPIIAEELSAESLGFITTQDGSYFYNKSEKRFEKLDAAFDGPYNILDKRIDHVLRSFAKYQDGVSDMEELLYQNSTDRYFLEHWLELKVEILRIERIILKSINAIEEFIQANNTATNFCANSYADLKEHLERTLRSATLQLSKLDYLYSFYNAKSNDKMNRMIYILTIISAIFLPLNLLVGFFGMNTSGLPFTNGPAGTYYAVSIMAILASITSVVVYVWRKKVER